MKKIEAIIKPVDLDDVKSALDEIGVDELTVSEVKHFGRQKRHIEVFRGTEFRVGFDLEVKIELLLPANRTEAAIAAILKGIHATELTAGKVFVSQIEDVACNDNDKITARAA
jgi:nitrogen regulatory protein PII